MKRDVVVGFIVLAVGLVAVAVDAKLRHDDNMRQFREADREYLHVCRIDSAKGDDPSNLWPCAIIGGEFTLIGPFRPPVRPAKPATWHRDI